MKALIVTPYYHPKIGGLENYARHLNIALHDLQGWEIVVVTANHQGKLNVTEMIDGMKVYRLAPLLKFSNTPINPFWPWRIRAIKKTERPDVVIAHSPVPSLADAAALSGGKTPFVLVYHAATLKKAGSIIFSIVAAIYGIFGRFTFRRARRVIAVSDYVKTSFPANVQAKTAVVPNGVWKREIVPRSQGSSMQLLFIGSLDRTHAWKGLEQILQAVQLYNATAKQPARLNIMGDGNARADYAQQAEALGIADVVTFLGAEVGAKKDATIIAADALVMYPTSGNDAFPTVLLEAWAKGVTVVTAAIGPMPSLINDGVDGYLVPPKDPQALASTFAMFAKTTPAQRAKIAQNAAKRTAEHYTWEHHAAAMANIIKEIA